MDDTRLESDAEESAVQVVEATALTQITKGEVDMQVATAKKYPRSIKKFQQDAMSMATIDEETASSCYYKLPRAGKDIEGPSVRLAEIVVNAWGNLRAETRVIDESEKWVTSQAMCWDLERNVAIRTEVRRRITGKNGRRYSDDMIGVTANAAASVALRNAIFKVVPFTYVKAVYDKCKQVAKGDIATLTEKRSKWMNYFHKFGIVDEQILTALGKASVEDVGLDDVERLIGWYNAIQEKTAQIDDVFPPLGADEPPRGVAAVKEKIMGPGAKAEEPPAAITPGDEPPLVNSFPNETRRSSAMPPSEEGARGGVPSPAEEIAEHAQSRGAPSRGELEKKIIQHCRENGFDQPDWDKVVHLKTLAGWVDLIEVDRTAQPWLE